MLTCKFNDLLTHLRRWYWDLDRRGRRTLHFSQLFPVLEAQRSIWNTVSISIVLWSPLLSPMLGQLCVQLKEQRWCVKQSRLPHTLLSTKGPSLPDAALGLGMQSWLSACFHGAHCLRKPVIDDFRLEEKALGGICMGYCYRRASHLAWDFSRGNGAGVSWRMNSK